MDLPLCHRKPHNTPLTFWANVYSAQKLPREGPWTLLNMFKTSTTELERYPVRLVCKILMGDQSKGYHCIPEQVPYWFRAPNSKQREKYHRHEGGNSQWDHLSAPVHSHDDDDICTFGLLQHNGRHIQAQKAVIKDKKHIGRSYKGPEHFIACGWTSCAEIGSRDMRIWTATFKPCSEVTCIERPFLTTVFFLMHPPKCRVWEKQTFHKQVSTGFALCKYLLAAERSRFHS